MTGATSRPSALEATNVAPEGRPLPASPVSFEAFHDWLDEDTRAEWVDGSIVMTSPARLDHQRIVAFLYDLLSAFVREQKCGEVFFSPVLMRLPTRPSGREPDLLFIATEHLDRLRATYVDGPADLVVEVVSPESDARDRGEKFVEYEAAGIPEYWLIDPLRREAHFYQRDEAGYYRRSPVDLNGVYHPAALAGFSLEPGWLWQSPLPSLVEIIQQRAAETPGA